ncbi:MAG: hypothetical protein ACXAAI_08355 [Promethearchaeota archaeon]|jgi:hypothetical protein
MEKLRKNAELIYRLDEEGGIGEEVGRYNGSMFSNWRERVDEELRLNIFGTRKGRRINYL